MEKIAVHCPTKELFSEVNKIDNGWIDLVNSDWNVYKEETCVSDNGYSSLDWEKSEGEYTIQSAEEYLKGGGDVEFKIGDEVEIIQGHTFRLGGETLNWHSGMDKYVGKICKIANKDYARLNCFKLKDTQCYWHEDWLVLKKSTTKTTKKENEMKRVRVLLINKDTDAVIFNEEMATEFSDADLKVLILLDKGADIKKSLGKEINVTLLHWEIKTITSYDKPEVK